MTTTLITLVSAHIFLLLIAAIALYALLLQLLSKKETTKKALLWRSGIIFVAGALSSFIATVYLGDYYLGKLGYVTNQDITDMVPQFVFIREILLPLFTVAVFFIFLGILFNSQRVIAFTTFKKAIIILTIFTAINAILLTVLGVLIP